MKIFSSLIFLTLMLFCSGCASILPGNDPIVVNAERTVGIALDTMDTFLKMEYDNREALKKISPEIFNVAEKIRHNGVRWIETATSSIKAYKQNRDGNHKANLITAVAVLENALNEARKYIALYGANPQYKPIQ